MSLAISDGAAPSAGGGVVLKSYGMVALAATLWGTVGVMTKMLYAWDVSPWSLIFFRAFIGAVGCGLVILVANRSWLQVDRQELPFLALYGFVSTSIFFAVYLYTISVTTVAVAVVLLYTAPVFAAVMARFAFGEAITLQKSVALLLCFAGCVLMAGLLSEQTAVSLLGIATGIGSALTYASFGIMGKQARRKYSALTIQFYALAFGTLFLLPILGVPGARLGPYSWEVWALMVAIAAGPTLLARVLYVAAVKHVEASRAAIVANIEPVTASVFAFILLGEGLSLAQIAGGCLVLAGSILAQQPALGSTATKRLAGADLGASAPRQ